MFRLKNSAPKDLTDEKLFVEAMHGNEGMFEELYNRYNKRLLYYFYRMLGNDEQIAQDFLQEVFFKVLKNANHYDAKRKFSTWIFSIAYNMCKNEYRSKEVREILIKTENLDVFGDIDHNETSLNVTAEDIYEELDHLDEAHKTAFLLKYREGLDLVEIGEILNLPVGTVKSRLHYTRKKIQANILNRTRLII